MFKLFALKLSKELEELKSLHRIQMKEKEAEIELIKKGAEKDIEIKTREVISLLKLESQQKTAQLALDHQKKIDEIQKDSSEKLMILKEQLLLDFQNRLTTALAKLHEEGNLTTKFVQNLALGMMANMPEHKTQVKMIQKSEKDA